MEIIYKTIEKDEKYLRQVSKKVKFNDKNLKKDIEQLDYAIKNNNNILALASIQIGIPKKIIYLKKTSLDILEDENYNEKTILINPKIINKEGLTEYWEACASCLENTGLVKRPYKITVEYYDNNWNKQIKTFEGFETTVICHEIDHLNGKLHIDKATKIIQATKEERKKLREKEPYRIINKTKKWN